MDNELTHITVKTCVCFIMLLSLFVFTRNGQPLAQLQAEVLKDYPKMAIEPQAWINISDTRLSLAITREDLKNVKTESAFDSVWIKYSSIVESSTTNTVTAHIATSNLPTYVLIKVTILPYRGNITGTVGTPVPPLILTSFPQPIIRRIGSCLAGKEEQEGHLILFSWDTTPGFKPEQVGLNDLDNCWARVVYTLNREE